MTIFNEKIRTPDLIYGLSNHKQVINELLKKKKSYSLFLKELLKYPGIFDSDTKIPVKDISQKLNIPSPKIRKHIVNIYDDILDYLASQDRNYIKPGKPRYCFWLKDYFNKSLYIDGFELNEVPREGETVQFDFLYPIYSYSHFQVQSITHYLDYNKHEIYIELEPNYNRYFNMKRDEHEYNQSKRYFEERINRFSQRTYYKFSKGEWKASDY